MALSPSSSRGGGIDVDPGTNVALVSPAGAWEAGAVTTAMLDSGAVTNAKVASGAAIAASKLDIGGVLTTPVYIVPPFGVSASSGNWGIQASGSQYMGGWYINNQPTAYQLNDYAEWSVQLAAGTWTLETIGITGANFAIVTVSVDGASQGTYDAYAAGTSYNVRQTFAGIVIASSGAHTIRFQATSKNASSTAYAITISLIALRKTA